MLPRLIAIVSVSLMAVGSGVIAEARPADACFLSRDWGSWRPSADSRSIYLRVGVSRVYRLDLSSACPELQWPDARLITKLRGGPWICSPLDLDLRVAPSRGPGVYCQVRSITPLSHEEAAALPKRSRP